MKKPPTRKAKLPLSTAVPSSWTGTVAEWRMLKRGQWGLVMRALQVYGYGAAYTPCGNDLYDIERAAARIEKALSVEWVQK